MGGAGTRDGDVVDAEGLEDQTEFPVGFVEGGYGGQGVGQAGDGDAA